MITGNRPNILTAIESMRSEGPLTLEDPRPFDVAQPPALTSLKETVVWVPYGLRGCLVDGLPRSDQDTLLTDIRPSKHSHPTQLLVEIAMHHDALQFLSAHVSKKELAAYDRRLLYRMRFREGCIQPTIINPFLPVFNFDQEEYHPYFQPVADPSTPNEYNEFAINAYLWARWVKSASDKEEL